jgi:uncharacterized protein YjiS (DUF1127 family)
MMSNNRQFHAHRRAVAIPVTTTLSNAELTVSPIAELGLALARRVSAALGRRRDAYLLAQADDHMLRDMGLTRAQIDGAVRFGRF